MHMTKSPESPAEGYRQWLPDELRYSAKKAPYQRKIQRAALPLESADSMYGFIGGEWHTFQLMKEQGAHYMPFHGKSAQLQLAKFSAGFFDKYALGTWMLDDPTKTKNAVDRAAAITAGELLDTNPWDGVQEDTEKLLELPFEETPFAYGLERIMQKITTANVSPIPERAEHIAPFQAVALEMGSLAAACYMTYAEKYLTPDQYALPVSQLEA